MSYYYKLAYSKYDEYRYITLMHDKLFTSKEFYSMYIDALKNIKSTGIDDEELENDWTDLIEEEMCSNRGFRTIDIIHEIHDGTPYNDDIIMWSVNLATGDREIVKFK